MQLVLIRGLPGSGKSTIAKAMSGHAHYETDQYFCLNNNGEYRFNPSQLASAHAWCLEQVKHSIQQRTPCVVSNTFTRAWEMQPYIDAAKAANMPVHILHAQGMWQNSHGVPEEAIERMRQRWEVITL